MRSGSGRGRIWLGGFGQRQEGSRVVEMWLAPTYGLIYTLSEPFQSLPTLRVVQVVMSVLFDHDVTVRGEAGEAGSGLAVFLAGRLTWWTGKRLLRFCSFYPLHMIVLITAGTMSANESHAFASGSELSYHNYLPTYRHVEAFWPTRLQSTATLSAGHEYDVLTL